MPGQVPGAVVTGAAAAGNSVQMRLDRVGTAARLVAVCAIGSGVAAASVVGVDDDVVVVITTNAVAANVIATTNNVIGVANGDCNYCCCCCDYCCGDEAISNYSGHTPNQCFVVAAGAGCAWCADTVRDCPSAQNR